MTDPLRVVWCTLLALLPLAAYSEIIVKGLTDGSAIVSLHGTIVILREGDSRDGVKLIRADNQAAVLEIDGRQVTLALDSSIAKTYEKPVPAHLTRAGGGVLYRHDPARRPAATSLLALRLVEEQDAALKLEIDYVYSGAEGDEAYLDVSVLNAGAATGFASHAQARLRPGTNRLDVDLGAAREAPVVFYSDALQVRAYWTERGERRGELFERVIPLRKYWKQVRVR